MKRVYRQKQNGAISSLRLSRPATPKWLGRWYQKLVFALVALLVLLFGLSCAVVAGGAGMNTAVSSTARQLKAPPGPPPEPPGLWAASAALIDQESGLALYGKASRERLPVASTTKIMTALVVRDQVDLEEKVTISPEAAATGEQTAGLAAGEELTVENLLWAMMVLSANDAASALAQYTAGSNEAFSKLMNREAARLGAKDTHFTNPHGLDQAGHYSTAYDLALMGRELMGDPVLAEMACARSHAIPPAPGQAQDRVLLSHNEILTRYGCSTGIKTGYTGKAGWCLVASAEKDGKKLVSAVLNSSHRADDTIALMEYGFSATERVAFTEQGRTVGRSRSSAFPRRYVRVVAGRDLGALTLKGSGDVFLVKEVYSRKAPADVRKGQALGTVECSVDGRIIHREKLVAASRSRPPGPIRSAATFFWYTLCWMGKIITAPVRVF